MKIVTFFNLLQSFKRSMSKLFTQIQLCLDVRYRHGFIGWAGWAWAHLNFLAIIIFISNNIQITILKLIVLKNFKFMFMLF